MNRRRHFTPMNLKSFRPQIEVLEERLPPGDALPGGLMAGAMFGSAFALFRAEPDNARIALLQPAKPATKSLPAESPASESATARTHFVTTSTRQESVTLASAMLPNTEAAPVRESGADDLLADLDPLSGEAKAPPPLVHRGGISTELHNASAASDSGTGFSTAPESFLAPTAAHPAETRPALPGQAVLEAVAGLANGASGEGAAGPSLPPTSPPNQPIETLTVPTTHGLGVTSRNVLRAGATYTLFVWGNFRFGSTPTHRADAQYHDFTRPSSFSTDGVTPIGLDVTGVAVGGGTPRWGGYRADHRYVLTVTGQGQPVHAFYRDAASSYTTHQGALQMTVFDGSCPSVPPDLTPDDDKQCCKDSGDGDLTGTAQGADGSYRSNLAFSEGHVRYATGELRLATDDLSSSGFGVPWGETRTWSNLKICAISSPTPPSNLGQFEATSQQPFLIQVPDIDPTKIKIIVQTSSTKFRYFDPPSSPTDTTYKAHDFALETLTHSGNYFLYTDTVGKQFTFYDFSDSTKPEGQLKQLTDPAGNSLTPQYDNSGNVLMVQRKQSDMTTVIPEQYQYVVSGTGQGAIVMYVKAQHRLTGDPNFSTQRQVHYGYYDGTQQGGQAGELMYAKIEDPNGTVLDTKYYRYYEADESIGYQGGLKYVFNPQSYARLVAAIPGGDPTQIDDTTFTSRGYNAYADYAFQYNPNTWQVTQEVVQGAGCSSCGSPGQGTYNFTYTPSGNPADYNNWAAKTVETLPDNDATHNVLSQNVVYTNAHGQIMLKAYQRQVGGQPMQQWATYYRYDSQGRVLLKVNPSGVGGYSEGLADLVDYNQTISQGLLNRFSGLFEITAYVPTNASVAPGYFLSSGVQQGRNGFPVKQSQVQYTTQNGGGPTVYPVSTVSAFRNTDGTGAEITSFGYVWYPSTNQVQTVTVSKPVISAAQNGPGAADVSSTTYDTFNRVTGTTDADGYVNNYQYDVGTGALTQSVIDAGMGHLNLTTLMTVDGLGRTTMSQDPNGNVTYTVYNDPNHEFRTYPGWNPNTHRPTGPIQVWREDRAHSPSYVETLTMSAFPQLDNNNLPNGTENISAVQSLTRQFDSPGGQLIHTDVYFNLPDALYTTGLVMGVAGTVNADGSISGNYWSTIYGYDQRGRRNKVQSPNDSSTHPGTITRTVYDGLSRMVSQWVGTNDNGATDGDPSGGGTAGNNMVQTAAMQYDGGGIGDSNPTQRWDYPSGPSSTIDQRETDFLYDWRDRPVLKKEGVQTTEDTLTHRPILYTQYDNLDESTLSERFDGDTVPLSQFLDTNGLPKAQYASLLRNETATQYDDQGRVYQTNFYSVSQNNGTVAATTLNTNLWFDHRGNEIKVSEPGGLVTKRKYDGASRLTTTYTTDEVASPTWADALVVTNNHVLTQTETTYDKNGNPILTTQRDRFHDAMATGALSDPDGGSMGNQPKARVYFVANYYDAIDRRTDQVAIGTNGGTAWDRTMYPTAPPRSDQVLVDSKGFVADSVQQVSLTGSPTGGTFTLTFGTQALGFQTTAPINFNASAAAVQTALGNLSNIGTGNVLVNGPAGGPWTVRLLVENMPQPIVADITGNGSGLTGGTMPGVSVLTLSRGGDAGRTQKGTDPRGLVIKTDYDLLGQPLRTIEGFASFTPADTTDKTTEYTYDGSGRVRTLAAVLNPTTRETTQYNYGVTGGFISSNDLLASIAYPGQSQLETYAYNALGEVLTKTDRNGSVHMLSWDILGRQTQDKVTTLGANVDGTILRLDTAYDTGGRPYLFTSYADTNGTMVKNQVERFFNGFGQLTAEYQDHRGAVILTGPNASPQVQYTYSFDPSQPTNPNHSRLTGMVYPNGRTLHDGYNTGLDDAVSRLSFLADDDGHGGVGVHLEDYAYLGLDTVIRRSHAQPGIDLTYIQQANDPNANHDAGSHDPYTGLDRFGRVIDQFWTPSAGGTTTDRFQYGYDRDSNLLDRNNLVNTNFGELYHQSGQGYGYDNFNQLTSFARGSLYASQTNGPLDSVQNVTHSQNWTLDNVGNWKTFGSDAQTQQRTHNLQNQIATITPGGTTGYDNNGNMAADGSGQGYVYDAWIS